MGVCAAGVLASAVSGGVLAGSADYFEMPRGWDLATAHTDIEHVGPCNSSGPYIPPASVLDLCDGLLACTATNYVPVQPGSGVKCAWLKTAGEHDELVSFVHRWRCNAALNATTVTSPGNHLYKYCPNVGDAYYDVLATVSSAAGSNGVSYAQCMAMCSNDTRCAACQTDGRSCTLMTTHTATVCGNTPPGCDAWFKVFD